MTKLIFGHDERLARWASDHIPDAGDFGQCRAIGMGSDDGRKLWGVVVYHDYSPKQRICSVSIASVYPRWATKETIKRLLAVPFQQFGVRKLCALIPSDNARSLKLCEGLGFRREATLRHHFAQGRHGVVLSMMRHEFDRRWGAVELKEAA